MLLRIPTKITVVQLCSDCNIKVLTKLFGQQQSGDKRERKKDKKSREGRYKNSHAKFITVKYLYSAIAVCGAFQNKADPYLEEQSESFKIGTHQRREVGEGRDER